MKTLGHSQIGLTMNTYTHVLPEIERSGITTEAVEGLTSFAVLGLVGC